MEHNGPHPVSHPPTQYYDHSVWVAMVRTSQTKYVLSEKAQVFWFNLFHVTEHCDLYWTLTRQFYKMKGAELFQERDKWIFEDAQHGILSIFLILYSREWRKLFRFWSWSRNPDRHWTYLMAYDWITTQIESSDWLSQSAVPPGASDDWHIWVGHAGPHYTDIRLTQATIWHMWEEASSGPDQENEKMSEKNGKFDQI